mmetsp:Transcript_20916/g.37782  ORF Transcript_20916/g.37782 Transcript_20916/m.37782 type:complete len:544 (-) Transcript_20916:182-1813(-)|eukprot:CAMPEP_0198288362 /NCGR_PEP_ID=MMETSP1449-20131203/6876_1 /TAXON_ID=420275 /ORGANISM="Attheya septentrionalis, Strain CCMP2084" /LENGTH=543 /DNA_ID=CAMNT_0043986477 /DNA_START=1115 /DNA_END=2746 /DNA_ORIENTATION=+
MALETAAGETAIPHERGLSSFVCACFTLNYVIGTGFLTLPWAFERSGLVLSTLGMMFICFIANLASDYVLSAMARAEALTAYTDSLEAKVDPDLSTGKVDTRRNQSIDESTALLQPSSHERDYGFSDRVDASEVNITIVQSVSTHDKLSKVGIQRSNRKLLIGERKFDLTELCQLFFGRWGLQVYGIAVVLDIYGFLWAYSSVFAAAMANTFPLMGPGVDCYPIYIVIFAIFVVPMSFLELSEQAMIQVFLSGCRIAMMLLMVLTPIAATAFGSSDNIEDSIHSIPHFGEQMEPVGAAWVNFSNIHEMVPVIVFAVLFHQAIPGLADEMKDKSQVGTIFGYTIVLCAVCYSLIGIVVGWYFGSETYESSNLNWEAYHAGTGQLVEGENGEKVWINVVWWARAISIFVQGFPAIDVISAFPLYAYVLGNSLMGIVYADNIEEVQRDRRITTFFRAAAAVPPIVGALFVRNLGVITDYSGLTGLAIAFFFPPLLYIYSEKKLKEVGIPVHTHYERIGSSIGSAKAMVAFGIVTIVYCFILLSTKG